ncbi:MAG: glycosyltransferase [Desulfamplus sp.]|nr:glycosyltransferase [Desulfamplus sp.]
MLVSIIVPTYNQAQYLRPCLDSIWFQDYSGDIEIVLVNDGSTDDTSTTIDAFLKDLDKAETSYASYYDENKNVIERIWHKRYPEQGRHIVRIEHEKNRGLGAALNTGFRACSGELCTYVPSDNICYPNMLSEMVPLLENGNNSEVDFVYSDMIIFDDHGNMVRKFLLPDYSFKSCFANWYLCGISKLYKKELHDRFGYYREDLLAHDYELFLRFAEGGAKFSHIPKSLMGIRDHASSREVEIHAPSNWNRLLEESKELALRARSVS